MFFLNRIAVYFFEGVEMSYSQTRLSCLSLMRSDMVSLEYKSHIPS